MNINGMTHIIPNISPEYTMGSKNCESCIYTDMTKI